MATEYKLSYTAQEINTKLGKIDNLATKSEVPTKTSDLTNDSGYITDYTEIDPTVPAWAKSPTKPTYTASEVGALPSTTLIPTKTSQLTNDKGYLTKVPDEIYEHLNTIDEFVRAFGPLVEDLVGEDVSFDEEGIPTSPSVREIATDEAAKIKNELLNGAGGAYDTLKELGDLIDDNADAINALETVASSKVPNTRTINGKALTNNITLSASDIGADASGAANSAVSTHNTNTSAHADIREQISQLSSEKVEIVERVEALEEDIIDIQAENLQQVPLFANNIEECTDTSKLYVLPDGFIYAYMLTEVEAGPSYTNMLPLAINADKTPYVGNNGEKGYKTGYRINSSRVEKEAANRCCTGFIPVKSTDTVRLKGILNPTDANINGYIHFYGSDFSTNTGMMYEPSIWDGSEYIFIPAELLSADGVLPGSTNANENTAYMRISTGIITDESIITINEEITEGGGTEIVTEYAWASTGLAFVPADYEDRIVDLENEVSQHTTDITNLKKGITSSTPIKDWDAPIYDANIPVFELSTEKAAMTNAVCTPNDIYAKYDALMARHPRYITKTDLGLCSDGVNHVYSYDFREPEPLHESNKVWSETKAKAIIVTGIHFEWAGIYAMYNALEEIADNPALRNFRRNTHLIVVPCCNPYATIANNYQSGLSTPNSYGVRNANGVEIHRNFEVDWVLTEAGTTHYGGAAPLSEVETQYIDNIMKNNTDAALFLSCHNCGVDTFWGTGFIWASTATKHMCNMGYRVIDKLSDAWMDKYGDTLSTGIAEYKTSALADGETRLGWTGLSTSPGTEAKQATKYGIQGTNVEICDPFQIHGTKANPEPSMSSFTMSRGAEVYVNFLLTAFGTYDPKNKKDYAPNLPWED